MFAYCNNNPVNGYDPLGEDAIWLQDEDLLPGRVGHTRLLIQDANGVWYHFYWGNTGAGILGKRAATSREALNEYLHKYGYYQGKYESAIYFEGDYE